jgi:hypothetical protein
MHCAFSHLNVANFLPPCGKKSWGLGCSLLVSSALESAPSADFAET